MRAWRAVLGLLSCAAAACQLPEIGSSGLPDAPIAIHYRTPEETRRRVERWQQERVARDPRAAARETGGVPHVDALGGWLGRVLGAPKEPERSNPGALVLLDPRSGALRRVPGVARGAIPQAWSADRSRLLYRSQEGSRLQLWELDLASAEVRPLTRGRRSHPEGCYAWRDRLVVTVLEREREGFRSWIALSGPGGRGPYRALSAGPTDHSPSCTPDGRSAAWVHEARSGQPELRFRPLEEGAGVRHLPAGVDPTFSPDGRWLVFSARSRGRFQLWRMRPDGTARAPLGEPDLDALAPSVSPDGAFVVYVASEQPSRRQLWLRAFGGGAPRMLPVPGEADAPVW